MAKNLPTRLCDPRDHPLYGKLAESDTGELEAADKGTAPAAGLAAVRQPAGAGVARELREADVILLRLQFSTKRGVLVHSRQFPFFTFDPTRFCHTVFLGREEDRQDSVEGKKKFVSGGKWDL